MPSFPQHAKRLEIIKQECASKLKRLFESSDSYTFFTQYKTSTGIVEAIGVLCEAFLCDRDDARISEPLKEMVFGQTDPGTLPAKRSLHIQVGTLLRDLVVFS